MEMRLGSCKVVEGCWAAAPEHHGEHWAPGKLNNEGTCHGQGIDQGSCARLFPSRGNRPIKAKCDPMYVSRSLGNGIGGKPKELTHIMV
jgi:hypothetical protein